MVVPVLQDLAFNARLHPIASSGWRALLLRTLLSALGVLALRQPGTASLKIFLMAW
ncbi:hypothetical protein ACNKHO_00125 [Shigella flexneri]